MPPCYVARRKMTMSVNTTPDVLTIATRDISPQAWERRAAPVRFGSVLERD